LRNHSKTRNEILRDGISKDKQSTNQSPLWQETLPRLTTPFHRKLFSCDRAETDKKRMKKTNEIIIKKIKKQ